MIKVSLRTKPIFKGRKSLYLDFYPAFLILTPARQHVSSFLDEESSGSVYSLRLVLRYNFMRHSRYLAVQREGNGESPVRSRRPCDTYALRKQFKLTSPN